MTASRIWLLEDGAASYSPSLAGLWKSIDWLPARRIRWEETERVSQDETPGVILLPHSGWEGFRARLRECRRRWISAPVVGVIPEADASSEEPMQAAFEEGLADFVLTPLRLPDLVARLSMLARLQPPQREAGPLEATLAAWKRQHRLEGLIGESPEFVRALQKVPVFAAADATVLILGETGSGKELFARALHYCSPRKSGPFVPINCGAVPEQLFENELFGHARGAFTDASASAAGLLAVAEGGTLFLDEVDSLPHSAQVKLLRLLQSREYRPLGSTRTLAADIRVVAATNTDPRTLVASGSLREDLYHRLNVLRIAVPSLRQRAGDIAILASHFLEQFSAHHRRPQPRLTSTALRALTSYTWPGNIRELEAVLQRAILLSGQVIDESTLDLTPADAPSAAADPSSLRQGKLRLVETFERNYLAQLLDRCRGNVSQAATAAGKERRTFQRLLQKHGIHAEEYRGGAALHASAHS